MAAAAAGSVSSKCRSRWRTSVTSARRPAIPATAVRFALAAPAREPAHLVAVLRERLARVALPAPVEAITLASEATAPLAGRNLGLLPGEDVTATVPLLDRLRARLGEDAVTLVVPRAEHRPERAWRRVQADVAGSASAGRIPPRAVGPASAGHRAAMAVHGRLKPDPRYTPRPDPQHCPPLAVPPRPVWLLAEPEPLGHLLEVQPWVLRDGPERIESGWWDGADVRRDYFVAENPRGETVWIYRDHRYGDRRRRMVPARRIRVRPRNNGFGLIYRATTPAQSRPSAEKS